MARSGVGEPLFRAGRRIGSQRVRARRGPMTGAGVIRRCGGYNRGSMIRPNGLTRAANHARFSRKSLW
jgi:hypothetical protein